ncbi:MAG TPA: serine hydrolase, partial [Sphingobacteriaceae bacterium]|nr:serine hydrolase [Sphingobacteriaceae bacterium]
MKRIRTITSIVVTAVLTSVFTPIIASQPSNSLIQKKIDSLMQSAMQEFTVAGAAIAVVKDGKIIHKKGYGIRALENQQPVDEFTNFQ